MGFSKDYSHIPEWVEKPEGYQTEAMVKYQGNVFKAAFWASKPGEGDPNNNGWRLYDELYDITTSSKTEAAKIIAYIPTWRKKEGFNYANEEMYRNITHGIISFLMFDEATLGEFEAKSLNDVNEIITNVVFTGHKCGTKILIALGGATDYGFFSLMERIGNNPSDPLLNQAVQNVVNFVKSNNLDGVDLDLECWWDKNGDATKDRGGRKKSDGAHAAGRGLTEFAKQLKQAMPDKVISAAVFATSWYGNNYDPQLIDYVEWVGVMTYDLTGSWNRSPVGPHTALFKIREQDIHAGEQQGEWPNGSIDNPILSVEESLWYWTNPFFTNWQGSGQQLPRNKIAAGVPIYGYDFAYGKEPDDLSGQIPPGYKVVRYKDILRQFPDAHTAANANIKVAGSIPRPPFVSASGSYPYAHNIYFETPEAAVTKLNFLKNVGAQGVIIWELSNDVWEQGKSIIKALYQNSGNEIKPPLDPSTSLGNVGLKFLHPEKSKLLAPPLANLVSQSDAVNEGQIKNKIMRDVLRPAAFLAHLLGYGWCGGCQDGKAGYVGEEFIPLRDKNGQHEGWEALYTAGCEGYMADKRLKIYFSDWSFSIKELNFGDVKNTEKNLMKFYTTPVDNTKGNTDLEQTVAGETEVLTQVQTYDLTTLKWEIGAELNTTLKTPLNFLGGIDVSVKVSGKVAQDKQTGIIATTSDKTTIKNGVKANVPPGSREDYRVNVYGTESKSDNCSIVIEARFALTFDGFLRWGNGKTPESNYHRKHRGSEDRPIVTYKFGSQERSFVEDLKYQIEHPNESEWDWNLLRQDHKQDLEWVIDRLTQEKNYTFNFDFGLEGIKGTSLEIVPLN